MRVLSLSNDQSLFNDQSVASRRLIGYGTIVARLMVVVPNRYDLRHELSDKVEVVGVGGWSKEIIWWRLWKKAGKILSHDNFTLITVQDTYFIALIAWRLARKFRLPLEIQVHGFERFHGVRKFLARFLLPRADGVRVVSQRLKQTLVEDFKVPEGKISVVPIFSDFKCEKIASEISTSDSVFSAKNQDEFIFLTVSRLVKVKKIETQIEALREIRTLHPEAKLWIVGDGPERASLERLVAVMGLQEAVRFWGRQDDLANFYQTADVFILTSDSEGWGLAVIEAGICGLPVLMTDVGLAGEVVITNESGLVVPIGDLGALVANMRLMIEDQNLRQTLASGLNLVIKKLPNKNETLELYRRGWERLLSRNG